MIISGPIRNSITLTLEKLEPTRVRRDFGITNNAIADTALLNYDDIRIAQAQHLQEIFEEYSFSIRIWQAYEIWSAYSEIKGTDWVTFDLGAQQTISIMDQLSTDLFFKSAYAPIEEFSNNK